jgi:hypothetical protein
MLSQLFAVALCMMVGCRSPMQQADSYTRPGDEKPQATQPASAPQANPAPTAISASIDPRVDALLDRLERSAADLGAFTARIIYEKQEELLGRKEIRTGELLYRVDPNSGGKSFAILFDSTIVNSRKRNELKHYIFNGRWLAEIDHANKQFIKREIVAPGKQLDPLKLGEGPFPLPLGQPKSEVLARFEVAVAAVPSDGWLKDLQGVDGIRLMPKPGTREAKDFESVELFYDHSTLLPVGIRTVETNKDRKTVRLNEVRKNPALDQAALQRLDITDPDPREWRIDVRPWTSE